MAKCNICGKNIGIFDYIQATFDESMIVLCKDCSPHFSIFIEDDSDIEQKKLSVSYIESKLSENPNADKVIKHKFKERLIIEKARVRGKDISDVHKLKEEAWIEEKTLSEEERKKYSAIPVIVGNNYANHKIIEYKGIVSASRMCTFVGLKGENVLSHSPHFKKYMDKIQIELQEDAYNAGANAVIDLQMSTCYYPDIKCVIISCIANAVVVE